MTLITGEIVILSDANTHTQPDAGRQLVRWFSDPKIGAVSGRLVLSDLATGKNADGLYWKYETFLKKSESRLGALLGCNGAIYALRAAVFTPIPDNTIIDDFVIPLSARLRTGCNMVYDTDAVAYEETSPDVRSEFKRRARIGAGGWQAIGMLWRLLSPAQGWAAFTFLSHKLLRWTCPFFMLLALGTSLLLIGSREYAALLGLQLALYATALTGWLIPGRSLPARLARVASMFVMMNAALLIGFLRWLQAPQSGIWTRTRRLAEAGFGPDSAVAHLAGNLEEGLAELIGRPLRWKDIWIMLAMVTASVIIMFDAWRDIYRVANIDEELGYVLLAPIVIAWLAWSRRQSLRCCRMRPEWFGLPMLIFGAGVYWYGFHFDPSVWRAGAVVIAVGTFMVAAGRDICLRMAPALAAAIFLIPIDPNGRYHLAGPLEVVTAQATQSVCDVLGLYVDRAGNMLSINGQDVTVVEACNGMRMALTLFLVCYVAAFTLPCRPSIRALLLMATPLVAIATNVVRLVPTVWMFGHASLAAAERFHQVSGWAMTVVAFLILAGLARLLDGIAKIVDSIELTPTDTQPSLPAMGPSSGGNLSSPRPKEPFFFRIFMNPIAIQRLLAALILVGIAGYKYATFHRSPEIARYHAKIQASADGIAGQIGPWVGEESPLPVKQLSVLRPNLLISRKYVNVENGTTAGLLIVHCADAHLMVGHFPLRCYPAEGWKVDESLPRDWSAGDLDVTGTEYHFSMDGLLGSDGGHRTMVVANCLLRPGGLILRDMTSMSKSIIGADGQASGAGQVQIYFDGSVDAAQRDSAITALLTGYRPVIDAVLANPTP